ncbi:LTA synthase family protein [uncultured Tenacibaculum sp.]|uniref:LTA synthase family protein n=1 Tax=uncultured Tenacibaculum sp. TaxID=174713 RepID=UPI00262FE3F0|nr:LTA synthase family protein [uncultured Tenacibaculum sp.]
MLKNIPNYVKYTFINTVVIFVFLFVLRYIFYTYSIDLSDATSNDIKKAYFLGIRFDIKLAVISIIPIAIFIYSVPNSFFRRRIAEKISVLYFSLVHFILLSFYLFDFGHFSYLNLRLNASALRFFENLKISSQVFFESYPVFKGLIGIILFIYLSIKFNKWLFNKFKNKTETTSKKKKAVLFITTLLLLAFGIYNSFTHYPLRWSQAFFSKNKNINQFSLNPVLYFFDSFKFRSEGFDIDETKKYYPVMSKYLGIQSDSLNFKRTAVFNDSIKTTPNVVFVMLESTGNGALSYYGNPIKSTPVMDSLMQKSINFTNHYVHKSTTAGSVFASVTGLPDVDNVRSASRNPNVINQRILLDQFDNYEKLYFLGGSANWANIRAVFQSNINGLKVFEEGSYEEENRADVWGIDDYDLFKEADKELKKLYNQKTPFVAYIQTATNHMPFTVPDVKETYTPLKPEDVNPETLKKSAYRSLEQLNALRYLDFNIGKFIERTKESGYFDNTIFVFFGDHQGGMKKITHFKENEDKLGILRHNVPFFIYSPKYAKPQTINKNINLIDIVPTTMELAKIDYTNYTLGNNALDSTLTKPASFIYKNIEGEPSAGLIIDSMYYYKTTTSKKQGLYNLKSTNLENIYKKNPDITKSMDSLLNGFYHSTKYLYYNNKKN